MKTKRSKIHRKGIAADFPLLFSMLFSLILLSIVVLIFYLATIISFRKYVYSGIYAFDPTGTGVLESVNYHSHQLPGGFPQELIRNQQGSIISSQELSHPEAGALKFVSYRSSDSSAVLTSYYKEFLWRQVYNFQERALGGNAFVLVATRGEASFDFEISEITDGSQVAIYYRLKK